MNAKLKTDALDLTSLLNGLVFFSPVSLLVRTTAGISLSQFFILQAIMATMVLLTEIPLGKLTDRIGYKSTLVLYQDRAAHFENLPLAGSCKLQL